MKRFLARFLGLIIAISLILGALTSCELLSPDIFDSEQSGQGGDEENGGNEVEDDGNESGGQNGDSEGSENESGGGNSGTGGTGEGGGDSSGGDNGDSDGSGDNDGEGDENDIGTVPVIPDNDPYLNVDTTAFYKNYTPATDYIDSYFRSKHGLLSGNITLSVGKPVVSSYRPMTDGRYVKNTRAIYSDGGETYTVIDAQGNKVMEIYKCGGYIALEEVAAYVYAFGTYPANHDEYKKAKPANSIWGKYLRVNHTKFSANSSKHPNEPALPNANGNGGALQYWEMDIGGEGYNSGYSISRGAYRLVYSKRDINGNGEFEQGEIYVFYTYNHYSDFQEYLNYYGGWGERFGYETGGSVYAKPSPYVEVEYGRLGGREVVVVWFYFRREFI